MSPEKPEISFEPAMPSHRALSIALIHNLDVMEKNISGIEEDIDIEPLHDFRVAGRRSRSLIRQVRGVYPVSRLRTFNNALSWLSMMTCVHRDLDVFLAELNSGDNKLYRQYENDLVPLHTFLEKRRKKEHDRLLRTLASRRFGNFRTSWRHFLGKECEKPSRSPAAKTPISDLASKSIWRNYKRLMHLGCAIMTNYNFKSIHRLRKKGKQLRYLIETFRSIYPSDDLLLIIKAMKKLQDNLGEIVDMHIQRQLLSAFSKTMEARKKIYTHTLAAVDRLVASTIENETRSGIAFNNRFSKFSRSTNQRLFRELFH